MATFILSLWTHFYMPGNQLVPWDCYIALRINLNIIIINISRSNKCKNSNFSLISQEKVHPVKDDDMSECPNDEHHSSPFTINWNVIESA